MKRLLTPLFVFVITFWIYLGTATRFTFHPKWVLDYFNPLAQSLIHGRLDIPNPPTTYDLAYFHGKWYAPWGILPAVILIFPQLILKRFIPTIYLTVLFASLDTVVMYLLLRRVKEEFVPEFSKFAQLMIFALFVFGTVHFYVGTLGSVWHVDQAVTNFLGTLGLFFIFKKVRRPQDYLLSAWTMGLALLGRATLILLIVLPIFLYVWQYKLWGKADFKTIKRGIIIFGGPLVLFSGLFFLNNYLRFQNPFEFGYSYIKEAPYLAQLRQAYGTLSLRNMPRNLWYMLFEIPALSFTDKLRFNFNLNGNSIFFLSPPLLAAFLASPLVRRGKKFKINPYVSGLWLTAIITILPSLAIYSTGWMQFGYRYSLDITVILVLLSVFGMNGKLNALYVLGTLFSVTMYVLGITALM